MARRRSIKEAASGRNNGHKEVIESIRLDPFNRESKDVDPELEKPSRSRLVSFEDQQELSKKIIMLLAKRSSERTDSKQGDDRQQKHSSIVDLDEAFDRWPPRGTSRTDHDVVSSLLSSSSSSWKASNRSRLWSLGSDNVEFDPSTYVNTGRTVEVIPEPKWARTSKAVGRTAPNMNSSTTAGGKERGRDHPRQEADDDTHRKRGINLHDVLRTRQWGQRLRIPVQLLRPPLIRRQPSAE